MSVIAGVPNFVGNSPGVSAVNSITGAVSVTSPDASVTISTSGQELQLEAAGGGSPGSPDGSLQFNNAGDFAGVPNSSVDPSTGDVTLGADLVIQTPSLVAEFSSGNINFFPGEDGAGGHFEVDTTDGGGLGDITFTSAGGINLSESSAAGILLATTADGEGIQLHATDGGGVGITIDGTPDDGFILSSNAGIGLTSNTSLGGPGIKVLEAGNDEMQFLSQGTGGQVFDATGNGLGNGGGTGPWNAFSAGGVSITDDSVDGIQFISNGTGGFSAEANAGNANISGLAVSLAGGLGGYLQIDATTAGASLGGPDSVLDVDATTPGVATLSTIFNAVGGYQANGVPGISGSGSTMTGVTVTNGIITAATFT